jgi:malonate-semialdehyde dehydrogenase (acetylating) / methylmalonate-semialdehyde dehydrogenase
MIDLWHFIGGQKVAGAARFADVHEPMTGAATARAPLATAAQTRFAVETARASQSAWARVNPQRRARVLIRFLDLLDREKDALAETLAREHGKTVADAQGDIQRGREVVEFCVGAPYLLRGAFTDSAGQGIDIHAMRQPLGVVAGITPFNFPAMIPMWMFAPAIACGNAFVLKPSERDPSVPLRLAEMMLEAGLPPGVLNVVLGDREAVEALVDDPRVAAISFVGSTSVAAQVYSLATAQGKRAQCFGAAKNHMVVMPDADLDQAADALIGAGYGSAGERCMAISVAVPVGEQTAQALLDRLVPRVESLRIGPSTDPSADFGPLVSAAHLQRVKDYVALGVEEGARLVVDGRNFKIQGYEQGFYMGGSLFDSVTPTMRIYREEIFGPVLCVLRAGSYEDALACVDAHDFGNGAAIFTRDGGVARDFASRVQVGMVGVNTPIPTPLAYYTFGGWKRSMFGDLNQHGEDAFRFFTRTKTVTSRWPGTAGDGASFVMPTMS